MARCDKCLHGDVCFTVLDSMQCQHFKDRSRFVERPYAEWVEDEDMYGDPIYRCSACNERFVLEEGTPADNGYSYCPNCGAKMTKQTFTEQE